MVDALKFSTQIEKLSKTNGVQFHYNTDIKRIRTTDDKVTGLVTAAGSEISADIVILCCAYWTTLFKKVKSNLVIEPMRGASIDLYGHGYNMKRAFIHKL